MLFRSCPNFSDYYATCYLGKLTSSGKKPDTIVTEKTHLKRWKDAIGHLHLDKIRAHHVNRHLQQLRELGLSGRTCNLALVCLRGVLKAARLDGFIKILPVEGIPWQRTETKARRLYTRDDIEMIVRAAKEYSKNGELFGDFILLLAKHRQPGRLEVAIKPSYWNHI